LKEDIVAPDETEMLRRILEKYRPVQDGGETLTVASCNLLNLLAGCVSLALRDEIGSNESAGFPEVQARIQEELPAIGFGNVNESAFPSTSNSATNNEYNQSIRPPDDDDDQSFDHYSTAGLTELDRDEFPSHFIERDGRLFHSHENSLYPLPIDTPEQQVRLRSKSIC
jgi:hypothetical protein